MCFLFGRGLAHLLRADLVNLQVLSECNGDASVDVAMEQDNVNNLSLNNDVITSAEMSKEADGEVDIYEDIVESQKSDANKISSPGTHHSLLDLNCMTVCGSFANLLKIRLFLKYPMVFN